MSTTLRTKIKAQILESDEFVLGETKRLQVFYRLKDELRYDGVRNDEISEESVAEHIYALHCLADYFVPLEDTEGEWDLTKIHQMLTYHDIDEIETGDTIGYMKTDADRALEREAAVRVVASFPESVQANITALLDEYEAQETPEAKYAKALDKMEPVFHLYSENGRKVFQKNKTTPAQHKSVKDSYAAPFPILNRFNAVLGQRLMDEGFYYSPEAEG